MKVKAWRIVLLALALVAVLVGTRWAGAGASDHGTVRRVAMPGSSENAAIVINELLPNPMPGEYEWVELHNASLVYVYLPLVLRNSGGGSGFASPPLLATSPLPASAGPTDISGWEVSDVDGNVYTVPEALPPVPCGGYVLILFDGQGAAADDYDFSDGSAVLHTPPGLVHVFEDEADQVALYTASIVDFVAYGAPAGDDDAAAVVAGIWGDDLYTGPTVQVPGGEVLLQGGSVGLYPGSDDNSLDDWAIYRPGETSPGTRNPAPAPYFRNPPGGIYTTDRRIPFGWSNVRDAAGYHFQLATAHDFSALVADEWLTATVFIPPADLPDGTYYYRVQAQRSDGTASTWSAVGEVTVFSVASGRTLTPRAQVVLGVTPQLQHKDSRMLCVDGHSRTGQDRWDSAHENDGDWVVGNGTPLRSNPHDDNYCTRAAISMIVDFYGGNLSQDRISYYHYDGGAPEDDLGHGVGLWPDELCTFGSGTAGDDDVLRWAMNGAANTCKRGKPAFSDVRTWIDAGRPILIVENNDGHSVVLDGYDTNGNLAHRVDPWTSTASWISYASWNISEYHCPAIATPRSDEATFSADSDNDGVTDFDEANRFSTSPNDSDADDDWVTDKWDLYEVYFNAAGNQAPKPGGADMDSDGLHKQVDPDNDGGGTVDGCEDTDYDGRLDAGETNNFSASDDTPCVPLFDIRSPLKTATAEVGDKSAPDKLLVRVLVAVPPAAGPLTLGSSAFAVKIEGATATILVPPYRVGDEYWLIVQPPTKTTAGYYDLSVTLQATWTDTETDAVHYSNTARGPVDEVLVVDNSGSMALYSKMPSAKNAARAFIDRWKQQDMVGVVAFSTTVGVRLPLTTITSTTTLTAARAAVNAMPDTPDPYWYTAIGSGLLEAKKQLAAGGAGHPQSIILLSDGMENVSPLWSTTGSSVQAAFTGCSIKVHTVALGPSQASWRSLLQHISSHACNGDGQAFHTSGSETSPTVARTPGAISALFPVELGNRLADIYLSIAELDGRQQRLWEATGTVIQRQPAVYEVNVPDELPEAIWTLNWAQGALELRLYEPGGHPVKEGDPGVTRIRDVTHDQFRVERPPAGTWRVEIWNLGQTDLSEYLAVLSAHSDVQMWLLFGLPPEERLVGAALPVHGVLADRRRIAGATVVATIKAPVAQFDQALTLYDDGKHADGAAADGLYGNLYQLGYPGSYTVKAIAEGLDNADRPFTRYVTRSFYVLPRVAYVYDAGNPEGVATAYGYEKLLEDGGFAVDLLHVGDITSFPRLTPYGLFVIGPETGSDDKWGNSTARALILETGKPVIGLGEGGYAFFGQIGLLIGYPHGWHGSKASVFAVDTAHPVWNDPYPIYLGRTRTLAVYTTTAHAAVQILEPPVDVTLIGREVDDQTHYPIAQQTDRFVLWGFDGPPAAMTEAGRHLFVNLAWYME